MDYGKRLHKNFRWARGNQRLERGMMPHQVVDHQGNACLELGHVRARMRKQGRRLFPNPNAA